MARIIAAFMLDECASTAIEYGLVAAGIAVAISTSITMLGCSMETLFDSINASLKTV